MHWKNLTFAWCVSLLALTCESQMKFWMSFNISQRVRAATFYSFKWNFGTARNSICSVRWKFEERLLSRPTPNRYWILIIIYNFRLCSTPGAVSDCWVRARRGEALDLFSSVCSEAAGRNREREPGRRKLDWKIFQAQCDRAIEHTHTLHLFTNTYIRYLRVCGVMPTPLYSCREMPFGVNDSRFLPLLYLFESDDGEYLRAAATEVRRTRASRRNYVR